MKTLTISEEFPCGCQHMGRVLYGEEGETRGWGYFNDENYLKTLRSVPKVLNVSLLMIAWSPLCWQR